MEELLAQLSARNIRMEARGGELHVHAPKGAMTGALRDAIAARKAELLHLLERGAASPPAAGDAPVLRPDIQARHEPFPLNDVQHAYWMGRQAHFELGGVSTHIYFEIAAGMVDASRLELALRKVIDQHDMLRAVVLPDGLQQVLAEVPPYAIQVHDLQSLDPPERERRLLAIREAIANRVIDCGRWPSFRIEAVQLEPGSTRLLCSWDFVFLDASSLLTIFRQWRACYDDATHVLRPPGVTFRDYVLAEESRKSAPERARSRAYWWDRLDQLPAGPALPLSGRGRVLAHPGFTRHRHVVPADEWQRLELRARAFGLTRSALMLACFSAVIARWSRSPHFCLNLTIFDRLPVHPEVGDLVGDFTNLMVVEIDQREPRSFLEHARAIQQRFLRDFEHRDVGGVEVLRELARRRGGGGHGVQLPVVFTSTLALDGSQDGDSGALQSFGPLVWGTSQTPQVWLDHQVFKVDGGLHINWDAVDALFPAGLVDEMLQAHARLLKALGDDPMVWEAIEPVPVPEEQRLRHEAANSTGSEVPEGCLHDGFIRQAFAHPDLPALLMHDRRLSYGELLARSDALAAELLALGVQRAEPVAILLEKGWEQVVAVLGVLIAGAAYVPLDVRWPGARLAAVIAQSGARFVCTREGATSAPGNAVAVAVKRDAPDAGIPSALPPRRQSAQDLAYVIFTSGSTGSPKGVMIDHASALNTVFHVNRLYGVRSRDRVLAVSELGFDLSVYDLFGALGCGAAVVIPSADQSLDPAHWLALMQHHGVTLWNSAPQLMGLLMDRLAKRPPADVPTDLRLVLLSGDWIPTSLPDRVRERWPAAQLISLGGATEGSIWSIHFPIGQVDPQWDSIPYGRALPNQRMYVLDAHLQDCPDQVVGDIHIGGAGVALGYLGDPERTAASFYRHPLTGERLYATGDLGRYLPDGNIEFLGREDSQVKLRGYRVELGEVAAALQAHPAVLDAVVQPMEQGRERTSLVAYVVLQPQAAAALFGPDSPDQLVDDGGAWSGGGLAPPEVQPAAIARALAERLPEYMLPQRYIVLRRLPLTSNGKVDLKALPSPGRSEPVRTPVAPASSLEDWILSQWKELLGRDSIGVTENFFDAGGDSLQLTRLVRRLNESRRVPALGAADVFAHPTVRSLAAHLNGGDADPEAPQMRSALPAAASAHAAIAIVGMAGRFPDAPTTRALWQNLVQGRCAVRRFDDSQLLAAGVPAEEIAEAGYVKAGVVLENIECFDFEYFGVTPREAQMMDPQLRFLLECAVEALDDAGYPVEPDGRRVGVFVGKGMPLYLVHHALGDERLVRDFSLFTLMNWHEKEHAATFLSYKLGLTGPSFSVSTACSTSLVAVHTACRSLLARESDMALAGGVSFMSTQSASGYLHREGDITSPDGLCRAFGEGANGTLFGSGIGLVVLKRLDDALRDGDTIRAVIRGTAINNDGARKVGYTAPSPLGQAEAIAEALANAGATLDTIQYIEAHGTGTALGDPIEFAALQRVVSGQPAVAPASIAIGSIKANIGHLDVAAGVTGLIKAVLALEHRVIPASLHAERTNPAIPLEGSPFYVNSRSKDWPAHSDGGRRAGVSSFGVGGTNVHVVLEEAPAPAALLHAAPRAHLLVLSARTPDALRRVATNLALALSEESAPSLSDVAYTLQVGRRAHRHRAHVVCRTRGEAVEALRALAAGDDVPACTASPEVVFLLPGQGSQRAGVGRYLYDAQPAYRTALDQCAELIQAYCGADIREILQGEQAELIHQTRFTQPLLFAVEFALARFWESLGVKPQAAVGHSLGDYVAACLSGVFSLEEALSLVTARGQLIQDLPGGGMLAAGCGADRLEALANEAGCDLAADNGERQCVAAGPHAAIAELQLLLAREGLRGSTLNTSHAFHSRMMDPILPIYRECVASVQRGAPRWRFTSSATGTWLTDAQAADPGHWVSHIRQPVRFRSALSALQDLRQPLLLEVGPGATLAGLARAERTSALDVVSTFGGGPPGDERAAVLEAVGRLWVHGVDIHWHALHEPERRRVPLPAYPFEKHRCWIERSSRSRTGNPAPATIDGEAAGTVEQRPAVAAQPAVSAASGGPRRPRLGVAFVAPRSDIERRLCEIWQEYLGLDGIGIDDNFFELGGDSLLATRVHARAKQAFDIEIPLKAAFDLATVRQVGLLILVAREESLPDDLSEADIDRVLAALAA